MWLIVASLLVIMVVLMPGMVKKNDQNEARQGKALDMVHFCMVTSNHSGVVA